MVQMIDKRKLPRTPFKTQVFFGKSGTPYVGFIKNLSAGGLAITAKTVFKPGEYLNLLIKGSEGDVPMSGQVRWTNRTIRDLSIDTMFDMGVQFTEYSLDYDDFIRRVEADFSEKRREDRYEKVYQVRFNSPRELMDAYSENISLGGLFVHTPEHLEKGSIVDVEILFADVDDRVRVEGMVVFVADEVFAARIGRGPGLGLRIVKYHNDDKKKFQQYLGRWSATTP